MLLNLNLNNAIITSLFIKSLKNMLRKKLNKASQDNDAEPHQPKKLKGNDTQSKYFVPSEMPPSSISVQLIAIAKRLNATLQDLRFSHPIKYCYNPVEYASKPHEAYLNRFCSTTKDILFIGMNPGPFGMCQTGVPFGEVKSVRDWMGIDESVEKPEVECPERRIKGFSCLRSEQSGMKFWGLFKELCGTPERFFKSAFVYNYCPLAFMDNKGKNITPNMIKGPVRKQLEQACDEALYEIIKTTKPKYVIGIGTYARDRCSDVIKQKEGVETQLLYLLHPSPIIPNNQNWPEKTEKFLQDNNLLHYFKDQH